MVGTTPTARPQRPDRSHATTRWQPRWTRLLEGEAPDVPPADGRDNAWWEAPSPSDARRRGDRQKALAGAVGTVIAIGLVGSLLWHATGVMVASVFRPNTGAAGLAPPTVTRTAESTATRAALTVTLIPSAEPPSTAVAPTVAPPTAAAPTVAPPTVTPVPSPVASGRVHTVERGDTLFSIARRNGTTVPALVAANGLPSADTVLSVGKRLVIP